jgi:anthranilate/para-aminobenzoate synthase component I
MKVETTSSDLLAQLAALEAPWALRREPDGTHLAFLDFDEIFELDADCPEESLRELLAPRSATGLTFSGWVGFFSYEFLAGLAGLRCRAERDLKTPGGWFGRPRSILRISPEGIEAEATSAKRAAELKRILASTTNHSEQPAKRNRAAPTCNLDLDAYRRMFLQAREEILDGNVYQIKISQRFETETCIDPLLAFRRLEATNPSPESFLLQTDEFSIVSCSPESVLSKKGNHLVTRPIGGTYERRPEESSGETIDSFLGDSKELREHNMLVDLERNDLSIVCLPGSVKIQNFRKVETYAHLHHLVSTIEGRLRPGATLPEILRAMLPGGTITGCPKFRAMELIDSFEPCFRGPYTGSFGTIEDNGDLRLNLIIRAIVTLGGCSYAQAGGGIVVDSTPEYERNENRIKAQALLDTLQ